MMSPLSVLPPITSKFWPRVIYIIGLVALAVVAAKTRWEILQNREQAHTELELRIRDRARADTIFKSKNQGLNLFVPRTEDVFSGVPSNQVRDTPIDPELAGPAHARAANERTDVEIAWTSPQHVSARMIFGLDGPRADQGFICNVADRFEDLAVRIPTQGAR